MISSTIYYLFKFLGLFFPMQRNIYIKNISFFSGSVQVDLQKFIGKAFMLRPFSSRQLFLHERKFEVWADKFDGSKAFLKDASFLIVVGLAGQGVSFRLAADPKRYIRHRNEKLYMDVNDNSALFKKDASFQIRYGLGATNGQFGISFESVNYPGHFISLSMKLPARGMLAKLTNSAAFKTLSTFEPVVGSVQNLKMKKCVFCT